MQNLLIQYSTIASRNTDPFRWQAAGYAVRSQKGRFVVYDGGFTADAEPLISLLEAHSDGVPEVDLWIITHPHCDHYGAALEVSSREDLRARVKVNRVLFCLPPDSFAVEKQNIGNRDLPNVRAVAENLGVPAYHAAAGDCYFTDDVKTEVLLTCEDLTDPSDANECSMITRVSAAGQTILFLGDAYSLPCRQLAAKMGTALKSDFCQLAHHALNGGAVADGFPRIRGYAFRASQAQKRYPAQPVCDGDHAGGLSVDFRRGRPCGAPALRFYRLGAVIRTIFS